MPKPPQTKQSHDLVEEYSRSTSLTVFEIHRSAPKIIPAYLLANLMSPALWKWREERPMHDEQGNLRATNRRLKDLQRQFHWYTFTNIVSLPGGDYWGLLNFDEEAKRLGEDFIEEIRREYDTTLRDLLRIDPNSQFGQIVLQEFYKKGYFPRLKNETIETMNAFHRICQDGKGSGKCVALAMLWASSLAVCGRFSLDQIILVANRAHLFVFLDDGENVHLFNNGKWYNKTRINNESELANQAKAVATGSELMFVYIPGKGMADLFTRKTSEVDRETIETVTTRCGDFLGSPLILCDLDEVDFSNVGNYAALPDPSQYECREEYQQAVYALGSNDSDSIYTHSKYAYRDWRNAEPAVYAHASARDFEVGQRAESVKSVEDAIEIVKTIENHDSIFESRDRIAMPDETLLFNTGDDRDRALLLFSLLLKSSLSNDWLMIGFAEENSYVFHFDQWIDLKTYQKSSLKPEGLTHVFNHLKSWDPDAAPVGETNAQQIIDIYETKDVGSNPAIAPSIQRSSQHEPAVAAND